MNLFAESTGGSFLLNHDNPQSETISYYVSTYTSIVIFFRNSSDQLNSNVKSWIFCLP